MTTRREFLGEAAAWCGALGIAHRGVRFPDTPADGTEAERLKRIGLQLYTVRSEMQKSVESTIARVAEIGYKDVEFAGYFGRTPKDIRALLDANGLRSPSAHSADFPTMRDHWPEALEAANVIGQQYVVCASLPPEYSHTADDYRRAAAFLNEHAALARRSGLTLGYHNHYTEFAALGDTCGYDVLMAELDRDLVKLQVDLYWMVFGGKDPLDYFARFPGRFFSVHVKDMTADRKMTDVGQGTLPFAKYLAAAKKAGVRYHFVERDDQVDPFGTARASFEYLRTLDF